MSMGRIILASASPARQAILARAGIAFSVRIPAVDERAVEVPLLAAGVPPREIAIALAEAKSLAGNEESPEVLTIGADQILEQDGRRWTKPGSLGEARAQLLALSGRTHLLHSAVAAARRGEIVWSHVETARLTLRVLSQAFVDKYLAAMGETALTTVGAYQVEGLGIQLFERIEGDHFTILGLPLLPLLAFLRREGEIDP